MTHQLKKANGNGFRRKFIYRRAVQCDIEAVTALLHVLYAYHHYDGLLAENKGHFTDPKQAFFLAYDTETPMGVCHGAIRDEYVNGKECKGPAGYLEAVFVKPEYRLQGVAGSLVALCENWAQQKGCREFLSDCLLDNIDSYTFHLRTGFVETQRCIFFKKKLMAFEGRD